MTDPALPDWIPHRLLTVNEVAELVHLSVRQIHRLIADGRLTAMHLGRTVRIRPEAVLRLVDPTTGEDRS